jgi:hypothetical protein
MGRLVLVAMVVGSAVADAHADGVGNEVTLGTSETSPGNPRSAYLSDRLWLSTDVRDVVTIRAEGSVTRDAAAAPDGTWSFPDQGGVIFRLGTSVDYYPSNHVALGVEADVSPETETSTSTPVSLPDPRGRMTGYAEILSQTSSWGVGADVEYDSAGDSGFEWVAGLGAGVQTLHSYQRVLSVRSEDGMPVSRDVLNCSTIDAECSDELAAALRGMAQTVRQVRISANALGTIRERTDVGIGSAYYLYTSDPTAVGYFSLASLGRDQTLGEGLALAPLRFTARPSVVHRIGRLQLGTWFQYGRYVADEGDVLALGLRVQVRIGDFRVWAAAVGQQDLASGDSPRSASVCLGGRVRL